jgi:EAL domain-containing protein (putative c-di-GMP-specific phosphodiesterase class I)
MERDIEGMSMIHCAADRAGGAAPCVLYRLVYIVNIEHLAEAYGPLFARALQQEAKRRLAHLAMPGLDQLAVDAHEGCLSMRALLIPDAHIDDNFFDETLVMLLSSRPFVIDGHAVIAEIAVRQVDAGAAFLSAASCADETIRRLGVAPLRNYVRDMAISVDVYRAIEKGWLVMQAQPIRAVDSPRVLYHECLARLEAGDEAAGTVLPDAFIPALEKTRFIRHFDRFVVRQAIDMLRQDDALCLGCNISALSAIHDAWWSSTLKLLAMAPNLAVRLVIELTETAQCPDIEEARRFCDRLRALGCRIAVDDFGAGYGSIDFASSIKPDVVKIDMTVMRSMRHSGDTRTLQYMVRMLEGMSAQVVAEGIETQADYLAARVAGIAWLQGRYLESAQMENIGEELRKKNLDALVGRLSAIGELDFAASTPNEKLGEYVQHARRIIESPAHGLSAREAMAALECYSDMLYRGLCGLPRSLGKPGKSKFPVKVQLGDELRRAVETVGAGHGAALRAQWKKGGRGND